MRGLCMLILILEVAYIVSLTSLLLILFQLFLYLFLSPIFPFSLYISQWTDLTGKWRHKKSQTLIQTFAIWIITTAELPGEIKFEDIHKKITIGWSLWPWKLWHSRDLWFCSCFHTHILLSNENAEISLKPWCSQDSSEDTKKPMS